MKDILGKILERKRARLVEKKAMVPWSKLSNAVTSLLPPQSFAQAFYHKEKVNIIAEIKKASPSGGLLRQDYNPTTIARSYVDNGAAAISVLTEEDFFLGSVQHLQAVSKTVQIPLLRKDFILDDYQVYEARLSGASAILLIAALLDMKQLKEFLALCARLDMEGLVEVHTLDEVRMAIDAGATLVGVNNRDLKSLRVSLRTSLELVKNIPAGLITISESGIKTGEDIALLRQAGFDGVLIGEQFMRAGDPGQALKELLFQSTIESILLNNVKDKI